MSELKVKPVLKCNRCGSLYTIKVSTLVPDDDGEMLRSFLKGMQKMALCAGCVKARDYYYSINRGEEWERGAI